jgi:hypothetical protein
VTANDVQDSKSVYEIAAPRLNVPQRARGLNATDQQCGWKQGNQRQLRQEQATTLALTGMGLLMEGHRVDGLLGNIA